MDILISYLRSETILDFGKWSNWKYTNLRICVFSVWLLPEVENLFRKQILNKNAHIFIQFFFSVSVSVLKSQNIDSPLYFQILLDHREGVILEIHYGLFRVCSQFLPKKSRQGGWIFLFERYPSKLIHYYKTTKHLHTISWKFVLFRKMLPAFDSNYILNIIIMLQRGHLSYNFFFNLS